MQSRWKTETGKQIKAKITDYGHEDVRIKNVKTSLVSREFLGVSVNWRNVTSILRIYRRLLLQSHWLLQEIPLKLQTEYLCQFQTPTLSDGKNWSIITAISPIVDYRGTTEFYSAQLTAFYKIHPNGQKVTEPIATKVFGENSFTEWAGTGNRPILQTTVRDRDDLQTSNISLTRTNTLVITQASSRK
jgi:hypothetical protein